MSDHKYTDFKDIDVSIMTIIGITNWNLNIEHLFDIIPITDYVVVPKKRGRKKKEFKEDPNKDIKEGSIITTKYKDKFKGVDLKYKKNTSGKKEYFRNAISIVMFVGKFIDFKISKNGKFQLTGCKNIEHAKKCVKYIFDYISITGNDDKVFKIKKDCNPECIFLTKMTNINFNVGFNINREEFHKYINSNTDYKSIFETSFGYTGVNIKIPFDTMTAETYPMIHKIQLVDKYWEDIMIPYIDYYNTLQPKDKKKELNKERFHSFLVFHSGKIIFSSLNHYFMKNTYDKFINIVKDSRNIIEEKVL